MAKKSVLSEAECVARVNNTVGKMAHYLATHNSICVSVSGGADSDLVIDLIAGNESFRQFLPKVHFVFSNTGLEYRATLRHLDDLEQEYDIKIDRIRGMPIPAAVKKYGIPFISKQASEYIGRLQAHGFTWEPGEPEDLPRLESKYGKCRAALRWWCNDWGPVSRFNIKWNPGLKAALMETPPEFRASAECCKWSKKMPLIKYQHDHNADLVITGERKSEGGQRARKSSCFERSHDFDHFMPLFFWTDEVKTYYEGRYCIRHSDCYEVYGLHRTGCVGCPFGQNISEELRVMKEFEPNLYRACMHVFGKSYELTDKVPLRREKIFKEENDD